MTLSESALSCAKQLSRVNAAGTAIVDLEQEIKDEIAETIRFYNRKPYALTEVRGFSTTLVSGQIWYSTVDLSSAEGDQSVSGRTAVDVIDILSIDYARIDDGATHPWNLVPVRYGEFERLFEGSTPQSSPTIYTRYGGQIGFYPSPSGTQTIYMSGEVKAPVPTGDSDTSVWLSQAKEMIEAGACKRVCLKYIRDQERAAAFNAIEMAADNELRKESSRRKSTGKLKSHL